MKWVLITAIPLSLLATPTLAQTAIAGSNSSSTGIGIAGSRSTAISGQGGRASSNASGNGNSSSALTINSAAQPTVTTANVNQNLTGTSTVKNVPATFAPGLTAAGLETCLGSVSGGASVVGFGGSFGTTVPDPGCAARLDSRTLWSMGLKRQAIARLCLTPDIYRSMPDVCAVYMPAQAQPAAYYAGQPLPARVANAYDGGQIELIDGKTGQPRMCNSYNAGRQRCVAWADGAPVKLASVHSVKPKKATASGRPIVMTTAAKADNTK